MVFSSFDVFLITDVQFYEHCYF